MIVNCMLCKNGKLDIASVNEGRGLGEGSCVPG